MALRSTVYKADLSVADTDRNRYSDHALTIARHPSETEERMMLRVLAFALFADERLAFGRGLSTDDEPDLWLKDDTGLVDLWIDVGLPDEKWVRKACGRARRVVVIAYGGHRVELWWRQASATLGRFDNLAVLSVPPQACEVLARLAGRSMKLSCTIQDGQAWIGSDAEGVSVEPSTLKPAAGGR
jgi:uncharacterized protein YaeQ